MTNRNDAHGGTAQHPSEQVAKWLVLAAMALFAVSGTVLLLEAQAFGWAALLFAAAAAVGLSTGTLGDPPRTCSAPVPPVHAVRRYRRDHPGASLGEAIDALRGH